MSMRRTTSVLPFLLLAILVAPAAAQPGVAVVGRVGTLGIGVDASLGLGRMIGIRAGFSAQPWQPSRTFDDIDFTLDLASPAISGLVDLYPLGGGFRLTGGVVRFGSDHRVRGEPTQSVDIGGQTYSPEQIGVLSGAFMTRQMAPYAGVGIGRLGGRLGAGFVMDVGVAFHGEPDVRLSASGPIASEPAFQASLEREEREIANDARSFRFFPVLSFGFVVGF